MTLIAKDFAAKLSVAVVAVAMVFAGFASSASAQTSEELQQMINDLLAQIAQLEGSTSGSAGVCVSVPSPLTIGSRGADVTALQNILIQNGYVIPAGATGYFGTQTQTALAAWQADNGVSPAVGYYGPITKAAIDATCDTTMDDDMDDMDDDMDDDDRDDDVMSLSGEGTLGMFEVDEEETEVSEGDEDMVVAMMELEAEDGDILLTRMNIDLIDATRDSSSDLNEEDDPWDVFDEFSVWVDGDKVGSFDASDEDEYTDEDGPVFSFRFTDLDLVLEEDEEVEVLFAVSVANSVDGADDLSNDVSDWAFHVSEVRYFDADDVATNDSTTDELDNALTASLNDSQVDGESGVFAFEIEEAGTDDQADIESSSDDPDAATLKVDDDNSDTEDYTVFIFDIDVDDESSDLLVGDVEIEVVVTDADGTAVTDADDIIADIMMTIDGETEMGDEIDFDSTGAISTTTYEFEFDEDVELEGDEEYEVTVEISFVGTDDGDNYAPGTTIQLFVDGQDWEVEGVEDDNVLDGTEQSEMHTLNTVIPIISNISVSEDENEAQTRGSVTFRFNVEADGDDDIEGFDAADIISTVTGGADTATGTLSRTGGDTPISCGTGCFDIRDGDEVNFAYTFTFDDGINGTYFVNVDRILGVEVDETSDALNITGN
jgi:hypothetical protein